MAALGAETVSGDFEVLEICYAGLPTQDPLPGDVNAEGEWVALASGLEMGGSKDVADLRTMMLAEWLLGELGGEEVSTADWRLQGLADGDAQDSVEATNVTRLILAGNSLVQPTISAEDAKKPVRPLPLLALLKLNPPPQKRYGYDSSLYSEKPTASLDAFLTEVLPSLPVDLMPGESDPAGPTMPQQPLHHAMLPESEAYEGFSLRTNPYWCDVGGARCVLFDSAKTTALTVGRTQLLWDVRAAA